MKRRAIRKAALQAVRWAGKRLVLGTANAKPL
jgi:hypothetical protein